MASLSDLIVPTYGLTASNLVLNTGLDATALNITPETLGIDLGGGAAQDIMLKEVTDGSRAPYSIPSITSVNNRYNDWNHGWTNGEAWTNYYTYMTGQGKPDVERSFWFATGRHSKQNTSSYSTVDFDNSGVVEYAKGNAFGSARMLNTYPQSTSYGPFRNRIMFIRNHHPTTTKSVNVYGQASSYWSSGYDGMGAQVGYPNQNGSYASVSDINWSNLYTYTNSTTNVGWSSTISIPPKTTVALLQSNTMYYWTSNTGYRWWDHNRFYNLNTTFSDPWIQPDLQMTYAASTYNDMLNETSSYTAHRVWNRTEEIFGDR